jgi:hypothetical protein
MTEIRRGNRAMKRGQTGMTERKTFGRRDFMKYAGGAGLAQGASIVMLFIGSTNATKTRLYTCDEGMLP